MNKNKLDIRDIVLISIFSAIICITSQLSIPMPFGVPMTLQTFIIPLTAVILGTKRGTIATIIYILLGAVGLPVFANFSGGMGVILGATGGFIISFPILSLTAGYGCNKNKVVFSFFLLLGAVLNYLVGVIIFSHYMQYDYVTSFAFCVLPFIPTTIIKIIVLVIISDKVKVLLLKNGVKL